MTEAALKFDQSRPDIPAAAVVEAADTEGRCLLNFNGLTAEALTAASCPLRPEAGDEVALLHLDDGRLFVTAVLRRASTGPQTWAVPEGLTLDAGARAEIVSRGELGLTSVALRASAQEAELQAGRVRIIGRLAELVADGWRLFGRSFFSSLGTLTQHLGESSRLVRGRDEVVADSVLSQARTSHVVQAEQVAVTAGESVRVDGQQINLA
jgi:hypothetical protein